MTDIVPRCATCAYWIAGAPKMATMAEASVESAEIGNCTVNPPTPAVFPRRDYAATVFAQTHGSRLCGEWVPRFQVAADGDGNCDTVVPFDPSRRQSREKYDLAGSSSKPPTELFPFSPLRT